MELKNLTLDDIIKKYQSLKEDYVRKVKDYFRVNEEIDQKKLINYLDQRIVDSENTSNRKAIRELERTLELLDNLENLLNYNYSEKRVKYSKIGFLLGGLVSIPWGVSLALPNLPLNTHDYSERATGIISFQYIIIPFLLCGSIGAALGSKLNDYKRKKHYQKAEKTVNEIENIIKQYEKIKSNEDLEEIERKIRNIYKDFIHRKTKK